MRRLAEALFDILTFFLSPRHHVRVGQRSPEGE